MQLRRRLEHRVLDRELERDRRGRAAVARSLEAHARHAIGDLEQLDAAAVRAEVGAHLVERASDALLHGVGMQVVQQQQVRHELVDRQLRRQAGSGTRALYDPAQGLAVEPEQGGHRLGCLGAGVLVGQLLELLEHPLDRRHLLPDVLIVHRRP